MWFVVYQPARRRCSGAFFGWRIGMTGEEITSEVVNKVLRDLKRLKRAEDNAEGPHGREGDICQNAIDVITHLSREKVVRGTIVEGGDVAFEEIPEGVKVDLRDFNIDGIDEENLEHDERGTYFQAGG
jgi:hypothetical protein